ncbi:MAG: hypothetical protein QGG02_03860, partial [Gammaproteobacteria bacterium]|nr:hypothetical protein [Gammaproteobacteria bacterium]
MMVRIKTHLKENEHEIYGGIAYVYKRDDNKYNEMYQFRMWLTDEQKYVRRSLRTKLLDSAIERGEKLAREILNDIDEGRTIFSITVREGVEQFIKHREKD